MESVGFRGLGVLGFWDYFEILSVQIVDLDSSVFLIEGIVYEELFSVVELFKEILIFAGIFYCLYLSNNLLFHVLTL